MEDFASHGKATPTVVAEEMDLSTSQSSGDTKKRKQVFMIKTPWFGISALVAVILFSVGELLVLVFADDQSSSQWSLISPNVCLSMLNNLATLFLTFSIGHGIAIAWWRKAMGETSIAKLQKSWAFSVSSMSILQGISHFNVIALAALMAKVAVIDGVLFQRAIGTDTLISWNITKNSGHQNFQNVSAFSRREFPYTGMIRSTEGPISAQTNYWFSWTTSYWLSIGDGVNWRDSYISGCEGVACKYGLEGVGFVVDCSASNVTDTLEDLIKVANQSDGKTIFSVTWDWHFPDNEKNYSSFLMNITSPEVAENQDFCPTTIWTRQCELRPALLNYTVGYTNLSSDRGSETSSSSLQTSDGSTSEQVGASGSSLSSSCLPPESSWVFRDWTGDCGYYTFDHQQIVGVDIIEELNIYEPRLLGDSRLAGIYNLLSDQFTASTKLYYTDGVWRVEEKGWLASYAAYFLPLQSNWCNYTYYDQTDTIVQKLNTLMLETSVDYNLFPRFDLSSADIYVSVPSIQYYRDIYYKIDFRYAWTAIGMTIFVVLCVLPSYWQFWILGREVTLGPLEIANAFRGPILVEEQHGHDNVEDIMKTIGHKKLRYQPASRPGEQAGFHPIP